MEVKDLKPKEYYTTNSNNITNRKKRGNVELRIEMHIFFSVHWVDHGKTLREQGIVETDILLLKRKYFYSDANIDSRDPIQLNLLYQQAKEAILNGTHPVRMEDAVQFAAFQCQVQFGDHRETTHKTGFLE